ncbi:Ubiquitin--protein ligase [Handroanthus impetiginosus]|uniref:RBR-type E3 ubiquitin transferase n=1 Tax=Handroanthus impetiginosus TaxID=429701 RepID=A0A2G9I5Q3_9LAMI|nr:Ubiquitin--protein ligase [Handroanthus impetiginosus]
MEAQQFTALSSDYDPNILQLLIDPENSNQTLISDSQFAEELQLQEAIVASFTTPPTPHNFSSQDHQKQSSIEIGESSQSSCEICAERKENDEMFPLQCCSDKFCRECISKHVSITIKKRTTILNQDITCPGLDCKGKLIIDECREILPKDVLTTWEDVICESMIPDSQKIYCPYKNCSALLIDDGYQGVITEAECPFCRRLFCARCRVPWHCGVDCEEFLRLSENERGSEDLMVHELAKKNKWQRCPKCKFFVEKNEGCLHMTCRCGFQFCYGCGATWGSSHGGCQ